MDANESSGVSSDYNKYGNNSQIPPSADADGNDNRDDRTIQRENFLNIYKENDGNDNQNNSNEPDLSNGIRFKRDADEDESGFEL